MGQNWGLPPLDPHRLVEDCYRYWITLVRASLQHAGALRIDHVLGLFRQYWIPHGKPGTEGAYVRFPTDDLLGIVALESVRHGAVIVGEDLGTVPPEVPSVLKKWGILSSRVLLFERDHAGRFRRASQYEPQSLATANTHDMATLAGFWQGRDIELKRQVGVLASDGQAADAIAERERERRALVHLLVSEGLLPDAGPPPDGAELRGALHRFLCRTPALLVGLSLEDLVGEVEPVNLPGVSADRFPSWTRRLRLPLEQLPKSPDVATALSCEREP
jgi:4-alpha-glucanotransferase